MLVRASHRHVVSQALFPSTSRDSENRYDLLSLLFVHAFLPVVESLDIVLISLLFEALCSSRSKEE